MYFKALIEITQADKIEQFIEYIYENYKGKGLDDILNLIRNMTKIPIQLLSKYLVRIYTAETDFYRDMNKDLRKDNKDDKEKYLPYIKVLYEGVRLKALPLNSEKVLYRGSLFQIKEIQKIKETINKKIENLPGVILFSKQFLSFSKKQNIAEGFLNENSTDEKLTKVMFTLEYDDKYKLDYNLSTHSDINQFSFMNEEEEVLFFPFSSFKVEKIEENKEKNRYEIKLLYLGKYLKELEEDKNIQKNNNKLPQTEFTNEIKKYLIQPQVIDNITLKGLYKQFEIYKDSIGKEKEPISITIKENYIKGEIIIGPDDINKKIKIISSFEQSKKENDQLKEKNPTEYNNEKEIKENCEIKINGISILFAYEYEFKETGTYKIEYVFKKSLTNSCFMFYDCNKLTNLDFSNFDSKNIKNMESMFKKCSSLEQLNLSKFNTENVTIMSNMFNNCDSLKNLNLSDFNTKNVTKMDFMFNCCSKLTDLNLSNFNTEKVTNMEYMFFDCNSLINLNVSKFNTQKVTNMEYMFNGCNSLKKLNLSSFETKSAIDMCSMFDDCSSLKNLDISKFTTQENTDIDSMFSSCDSLKIENLNAKDRKILNEFKDK